MRITASEIAMESRASTHQEVEVKESITAGFVRAGDVFTRSNLVEGVNIEQTQVRINPASEETPVYNDLRRMSERLDIGKYSFDQLLNQASNTPSSPLFQLDPEERFKIELLKVLYETITGKSFSVGMLDLQSNAPSKGSSTTNTTEGLSSGLLNTQSLQNVSTNMFDFGAVFTMQETTRTDEKLQFASTGTVKTADGKTIDIDLSLNMSRSLEQSRSLQIRAGAALKDPLVINFSGQASELTARQFEFDLDMDGTKDTINQLSEQSGYIALDKNNNGAIDDGSELFGATSGNGFKELAAYDDDGNGFIDEGDQIWDQLKIWVQHDNGSQSLLSLADKGVGALYLGYTDTPWDLTAGNSNQELAGKVRSTGIFLFENGEQGSLQQVDLVI